jgi:putative heme iron utilization protein
MSAATVGVLSTILEDGYPFGSLVTFAIDAEGRPIFLFSKLAEHTTNLAARRQTSLLVLAPAPEPAHPLDRARVTVVGQCSPVPTEDVEGVRRTFLARRPEAEAYAGFADFAFHRLEPARLRFVGGFGQMAWVSGEQYRQGPWESR